MLSKRIHYMIYDNNQWLIAIFLTILLSACNTSSVGNKKGPSSGYIYEQYITNPGEKPSIGDHVFFEMNIYDDKENLLQSYRNQKTNPSVKIVDQSNQLRKQNPVLDVAATLSVGDSVGIIVPADSVPNMPPGYEDVAHIEYHLLVTEILDENEFQAKLDADRAAERENMDRLKGMLPEIETITDQTLKAYKAGNLELSETANGVKYYIHEKGDGDLPTNDRMITMQYFGRNVADGSMFDNSYTRGRGYTFRLGRREVIRGWDEVTPQLPVGTTASVFIPAELGYGAQGSPPSIPPNAELYFYLTVEEMYY